MWCCPFCWAAPSIGYVIPGDSARPGAHRRADAGPVCAQLGADLAAKLRHGRRIAAHGARSAHDLFGRLQKLPLRFFDQRPHGDLMSRLTNDVENVNQVSSDGVVQIVSGVLTMVGVAARDAVDSTRRWARQPAVSIIGDDADAQPRGWRRACAPAFADSRQRWAR